MLAVFNAQTEIPVRRRVAFELVGDQHTRRTAVLPEQLAHEPHGCVPVAPALHQHVKHRAMLVHRTPQPALLAVDRDDHFIEVPLVAARQGGRPDTSSNAQAELHAVG